MGWWGTSCPTSLISKKTLMEKPNIKYGLLLSKEQLDVLTKSGCYNRLNVYRAICDKTTIEPYEIVKRGVHLQVQCGECLYPNTQIEKDLGINRKTVQEIIHELNMVGIIKSTTGNRGTVHINQALSSWVIEGVDKPITNPFYSRNPSCQATKGLKPKKPKVLDSTKESVNDCSLSPVDKVNVAVPVPESQPTHSADMPLKEPSSSLISSPSPSVQASVNVPFSDDDKNKYAAQKQGSSKFGKYKNKFQKHHAKNHKH